VRVEENQQNEEEVNSENLVFEQKIDAGEQI